MVIRAYQPQWTKTSQKATMANLDETAQALLMDYERLAGTVYEYEGLEELDEPLDRQYIESLMFWNTAIGITEGDYIMGGKPSVLRVSGQPAQWTPVATNITTLPKRIIKKYNAEKFPCMKIANMSIADSISDECILQASAYVSSGQNTIAMRTPVVVYGLEGSTEINYIKDGLTQGVSYVPYFAKGTAVSPAFGVEALDLKAQNWLDPLTGFAEFMHTKILGKLGIDALGSQKASGITSEEATLILAQIRGIREDGLEVREKLCKMINDHIDNANISVKIRDIYMEQFHDDATREDALGLSGSGPRNNAKRING